MLHCVWYYVLITHRLFVLLGDYLNVRNYSIWMLV
jgi:hypothetical protein